MCKNGYLAAQDKRTVVNQCGKCYTGYILRNNACVFYPFYQGWTLPGQCKNCAKINVGSGKTQVEVLTHGSCQHENTKRCSTSVASVVSKKAFKCIQPSYTLCPGPVTTTITTTKAPTKPPTMPPTASSVYVKGTTGKNVCPSKTVAVPEAECLAAHKAVLPSKEQALGRIDYKDYKNSWSHVPPGCSFQNVPNEPSDVKGLWVRKRVRSIWWVEPLLHVCRG